MIALGMALIVFFAALFYDHLPFQLPACSFRTAFGIPCIGCGGTRAMLALVGGHPWKALRLNPAVILAFFGSLLWPLITLYRYHSGAMLAPIREHHLRRILLVVIILLFLNWLYLINSTGIMDNGQ